MTRSACRLLIVLACALGPPAAARAQVPPAPGGVPPPEGPPEPTPPPLTTAVGSLAPEVYFQDISYTLRLAYPRTVTVSRANPAVAYAGSYDGYVWKTVDGGRTWDESRLIVEQRPFYGDFGERLYFGRHRTSSRLQSSFDTEVERRFGPLTTLGGAGASEGAEGGARDLGRGAQANVNFGIGVPGGAPRLQLLVRKFGKPTSGLNIQQTLLLRGTRPLEIRQIVINPHNEDVVFACTMFGLFKSDDGGRNWVRTFAGTSPSGWRAFHVAVDPNDAQKVLLGTGEGLYVSRDGGANFTRTTKKGVGEGVIDWIYFSPYDSRFVFVGTDYGLLRSSDGGESWDWIYFTTFPAARVVRYVEIDPFDKRTGYIATHDGLFTTPDILTGNLEDWKRLGGLKFTGIETIKIAACPRHKGHLWAITNLMLVTPTSVGATASGGGYIMESVDGGANWNTLFTGHTNGSMEWFDNDPRDPDLLWLAWSRAMLRMRRQTGTAATGRRQRLPDTPSIGEVLQAALRYTGTDPAIIFGYRRRSRFKALVPRVEAQYLHYRWKDYVDLHAGLYPSLPFRFDEGWNTSHDEFRLLFLWDFSDLVFNLNESMFGRVDRLTYELRTFIYLEVHRFYGELRRLQALMANLPPKDLRVRLMYRLRIEELTAHMDFLTGGYLTRWRQGDHPSARATKWWEPWTTRR